MTQRIAYSLPMTAVHTIAAGICWPEADSADRALPFRFLARVESVPIDPARVHRTVRSGCRARVGHGDEHCHIDRHRSAKECDRSIGRGVSYCRDLRLHRIYSCTARLIRTFAEVNCSYTPAYRCRVADRPRRRAWSATQDRAPQQRSHPRHRPLPR